MTQKKQLSFKLPEDKIEKKANIVFHIISAQLKQNSDETQNKMDAYVKINIAELDFKTQVALNQGYNPIWNYETKIYVSDFESMINLEVCDWDNKNDSQESPATAKINLKSALNHDGNQFTLEVLRQGINFGYIVLKVEEMEDISNRPIWYGNKDVQALQKYLQQSGLSKSCQVIFSEILSRDVPKEHVFTYTALRLRQIGADLQAINSQHQTVREDKILDMINE